mgnify:FL=1
MTGQQLTVVHPATGEILDLAGQPTDQLAGLLNGCRVYQQQVADFREQVEQVICDRMDRQNQRTAVVGTVKLTVNAQARTEWDLERLRAVLADLVRAGLLNEDAAAAVIERPVPKPLPERVNAAAARKLEGHEQVRECARKVAQRRTVKIERLP